MPRSARSRFFAPLGLRLFLSLLIRGRPYWVLFALSIAMDSPGEGSRRSQEEAVVFDLEDRSLSHNKLCKLGSPKPPTPTRGHGRSLYVAASTNATDQTSTAPAARTPGQAREIVRQPFFLEWEALRRFSPPFFIY